MAATTEVVVKKCPARLQGAGPTLDIALPTDAPAEAGSTIGPPLPLEEAERHYILAALAAAQWRIRGEGGAAEQLGIHEATLRSRMKNLGISRPSA